MPPLRDHFLGHDFLHGTQAGLHDRRGIHLEMAPQRRTRIAAAEAVGTQRHVASAGRQEGTHQFRQCTYIVGGGDDRPNAALQLQAQPALVSRPLAMAP